MTILDCCPSESNGFTFCSGSLGAVSSNDLPKIIQDFGAKMHFIHLRNICREENGRFYEARHLEGSIPMEQLMRAIIEEQCKRELQQRTDVAIPLRPDHGHVFWDDKERKDEFYPGYSLIGRALGLAELSGLELGIREHIVP